LSAITLERTITAKAIFKQSLVKDGLHIDDKIDGGNDRLEGGGRIGGPLDGGSGNDLLIQSFGELIGGAGADSKLVLDFGTATNAEASVDQIIYITGMHTFDPGWVTITDHPV
jgi:hypothetical protein